MTAIHVLAADLAPANHRVQADNLSADSAARRTLRLGTRVAPSDPYWVMVCETIRQRAQELGVALVEVNLPLDMVTGEAQLSLIEDLLAQELDALLTPRLPETLARQIVGAGLPLVFADEMEYSRPGTISPRGLDDAAAAAARYVLDHLHEAGTVVIAGSEQRYLATVQRRVNAFTQTLAQRPSLRCVEIPCSWRYDEAFEQIMEEREHWLAAIGPEPVAAIYGISDPLALAARDAGRQLGFVGERTLIVGINGDPLALAAIIEGAMHASIETSAWDLARRMVDWGWRAARGEALPAHIPYATRLFTAGNAALVAAEKLVAIADLPSRLVDVNLRHEQQRLVQMETSLEINRRVGSMLDGAALLRELADTIRTRYEFDRAQIFWWHEADRCFAPDAPEATPPAAEQCIALEQSGVLGDALLRNHLVYIPDALASTRYRPDVRCPDVRARVVLPMRVGGKTVGVLDLHSQRRSPRAQIVLDALQTLADQLGIALRNAQSYAQALEAKTEAERASQLKSRLLANVSHELRTPLNIILGYSQAALGDPNPYETALPPELVGDLQAIQGSGQHLVRLIDDLLNVAQAESGALEVYPEWIDARALLEEVFRTMAATLAQPAVAWRLHLPDDLPPLCADPVRLRQVLLNLLSNAAKFTRSGHVELGAAVEQAPDKRAALHVWIEDTGVGIPRADQEHLFESFQSALEGGEPTRALRGVGLGLYVAQQLVALHGGALTVESRRGHGTTCHITLPLRDKVTAQVTEPVLPADPTPLLLAEAGPESAERVLLGTLQHASPLTQAIAAYLIDHYPEPIARDEIAGQLKVSPNYLSRVFRSDTGMTPWEFLSRYRTVQAQKLLLTTQFSITEVAERVGYNDAAYFVRVFHRETGQAPLRYRKSAK